MGHGAKSLKLHKEWSQRITEEFLQQGDNEKQLGIPISSGMDRNLVTLEASQREFLEDTMLPLFTIFVSHFKECQGRLEQINSNLKHWQCCVRGDHLHN